MVEVIVHKDLEGRQIAAVTTFFRIDQIVGWWELKLIAWLLASVHTYHWSFYIKNVYKLDC